MAKGIKTGGRQAGTPNKATSEFRSVINKLLEDNAGNFQRWLTQVAEGDGSEHCKPNPGKALDIIAGLAEYVAPKLARTEVTGADGGPLEVENTLDVSNLPTDVLTAIMAARDAAKRD